MESIKILFITTSHDQLGDTDKKTGLWLEELAAPYYIFKEAGVKVTISSPLGGRIPLDPRSLSIMMATPKTKRFLGDEEAMEFLYHSIPIEKVKADDFDAVFLPGGHGPMWDFTDNKILKQLLETFNAENKPIGSVCHGVVSLLSLLNENGISLIQGKQLTAFSNSEEESSGMSTVVPFLLETRLLALGALYSKGTNYISYVVTDGNIITGQNPASSEETAKRIVSLLALNKPKSINQDQPVMGMV